MIPAPADYLAAESKRSQRLVYEYFIYPYPFPTGLDGSGTLVNCHYVAPGRIEVNFGAAAASWTSLVLTNPAEVMPAAAAPAWSLNLPGFAATVQYRTGGNAAQLTGLPWQTLTGASVQLYRYYQFQVVWTGIRAWFAVAEADDPMAFWWVEDLPSDHASYFCEGRGIISYFANFSLTGRYQINPADIADPGELDEQADDAFGSLVAAQLIVKLFNRRDKFTPGHNNFFLMREANWYRKNLSVTQRYDRPKTGSLEIFRGTIEEWGPRPEGLESADGPMIAATVQVTANDLVTTLLRQRIGVPDDDGTPRPWVCGEVLRQADQLADESIQPPDQVVDLESGDIFQFASLDLANGGALTATGVYKVSGSYGLAAQVAAAGARARGFLALAVSGNRPLFSAWLLVPELPSPAADRNLQFLGLVDANGNQVLGLYVGVDYKVWLLAAGVWKETSWYLHEDVGVFKRVSLGLVGTGDGVIKVWVNSSEVLSEEGDWSGLAAVKSGWIGAKVAAAEPWTLYYDDLRISGGLEKYAYRLRGGPYQEISRVYQDGAVRQELKKTVTPDIYTTRWEGWSLVTSIVSGTPVTETLIQKRPELGVVVFHDPANPPKGTVYFRARKNDRTHPVDVLQEVLQEAGLPAAADPAVFAAARAVSPADAVGCYFEDQTLADVVKAVGEHCLLDYRITAGQLTPLPYIGRRGAPVATIVNWSKYQQTTRMQDIISRVRAKYGWYDRNKLLFCKAVSLEALKILAPAAWTLYLQGQFPLDELERLGVDQDLDFTWGQSVAAENGGMVQNKVDLSLIRRGSPVEVLDNLQAATYGYARLQVGDSVLVAGAGLDPGQPYWIRGRNLKLLASEDGLTFTLKKYLGETLDAVPDLDAVADLDQIGA